MPVSARIPDKIRPGVFCTGVMILQAHEEFVFDFVSAMVQPQQIVARVILSALTTSQLLPALRGNVARYQEQFGPLTPRSPTGQRASGEAGPAPEGQGGPAPAGLTAAGGAAGGPTAGATAGSGGPGGGPASPKPPQPHGPGAAELYEQLKLPDEVLGGAYANTVMISHTPEEFCFDFIASFYPRPIVTCRVFMAAGRVVSLLETLGDSFEKYQHRRPRCRTRNSELGSRIAEHKGEAVGVRL